ncbi:MAG TPA: carbonic anhydrase [Anaerolineae bacterium]|nr:carbonic anhydrase [Anaerolineae bacterium]
MITQTQQTQEQMTPEVALEMLKAGHQRFLDKKQAKRNLLEQIEITSSGQYPFAVILGCIDSRVPPELIFDLGIGDVFSIRIAGNFVNEDILGSMEFATKVIGSKHILVLGHTSCGAIQGAKDQVELGNLTGLVNKLQPAVEVLRKSNPDGDLNINHIAEANVRLTVEEIQRRSPILKEMLNRNEISISGAMYDVATGKVEFLQ